MGKATSLKWPVGLGGKGNEGVAAIIEQTPNAIGYVELIYALQNKMPYGEVQNRSGKFVKADLPSVSSAAAGVQMPEDFRVSITDSSAPDAYPITSFTRLLIPRGDIGLEQEGRLHASLRLCPEGGGWSAGMAVSG